MALQASLIGEIYSDIRAVVFKYDANMNHFILRYYQEREPNVNDYESISIVTSNFLAQFKFSDFENTDEECFFSKDCISQLDALDGFVFCRNE